MAKAKKSESTASSKAPAEKAKAPAKKGAKASGGGSGSPQINTDFAAQSAARMLMNRAANTPINTAPQKKESSTFKQMKDSLAKPHLASMDSMLNSTSSTSNQSHLPHQNNQKGHSQTYNADVARTGVPRRTPG
jgi:hypothetical protein